MTLVALLLTFILAWHVQTSWVFYIWWGIAFLVILGVTASRIAGGKK